MKDVATWIRAKDVPRFHTSFDFDPEIRLWDARVEEVPWEKIKGLLLTGGEDIGPPYLKQPVPDPSIMEDEDPARDAWEFPATERVLKARLPILAICRGHQVLNTVLGGTLHLHIPGHGEDATEEHNIQPIRYVTDPVFKIDNVNSSHHQAIDQLGKGLHVVAVSAVDGIIEEARLENYPFCLSVQYHPERDKVYRPIFEAFAAQL